MPNLNQKLTRAKRGWRTKLWSSVFVASLVVILAVPAVYFAGSAPIRIIPPQAADKAELAVVEGVGVVLFDKVYLFGAHGVLGVSAPGFIRQTVNLDLSRRNNPPLLIQMQPAPARVVITTNPARAQTRWHVNGEYIDTGEKFDRRLEAGKAVIELNHDFFHPQRIELDVERAKDIAKRVDLIAVDGSLAVRSEPIGAHVTINGEDKGDTPMQLWAAGGVHRVKVALEGYQTIDESITITNAQPAIERDYRLQAAQIAVAVEATPAGGVLYVNGVASVAPLLLAGGEAHVLRYEKAGYVAQTHEIPPTAAKQVELKFALQEEVGELTVRSTPSAELRIHGKLIGSTPQTLQLQAVAQPITLTRAGYRSVELTVTPSADAPLLIDETLQTELAARLAQAKPTLSAAAGITLKFFDPRAQGNNHFTMGAPVGEPGRRANEFQREVILTRAFYVSTTEINEAQFSQYLAHGSNPDHPVRNISWAQAAEFCNWLSAQDGLEPVYRMDDGRLRELNETADGYRLPTEAEWEWLARIAARDKDTPARFIWGNEEKIPKGSGNFADESVKGKFPKYIARYKDGHIGVAPVGSFAADTAGLYDMAGNVREWVHDGYDLQPPEAGVVVANPFGPVHDRNTLHIIKGAGFRSASMSELRASFRGASSRTHDDVGFRVVRYLYGKE